MFASTCTCQFALPHAYLTIILTCDTFDRACLGPSIRAPLKPSIAPMHCYTSARCSSPFFIGQCAYHWELKGLSSLTMSCYHRHKSTNCLPPRETLTSKNLPSHRPLSVRGIAETSQWHEARKHSRLRLGRPFERHDGFQRPDKESENSMVKRKTVMSDTIHAHPGTLPFPGWRARL